MSAHDHPRTTLPPNKFCRELCNMDDPDHGRTTYRLRIKDEAHGGVLTIYGLCAKEADYLYDHADNTATMINEQTGEWVR